MALTPRLASVEALFHKLERELYRAFHHEHPTHKADHFYNFCITAHSMRDYLFERLGKISNADRASFDAAWSQNPVLASVADIANSAKHFQLRDARTRTPRAPRTKSVKLGRTTVVDIYRSSDGEVVVQKRGGFPTYYIVVDGGRRFELYAFMEEVIGYWRAELRSHAVRLRRQSWKQLSGSVT